MTTSRGYSNEKARKELGWEPRYPSWRRDSVPGSAAETDAAGYRPLFSIAYGMTGSVGDAEDIVQDEFLGLTRARQAGTVIADLKVYLTTAVTRLGISDLSSARVRRERYVGTGCPSRSSCPPDRAGRARRAGRLAVDGVPRAAAGPPPVERAAFMLREVFGNGYPDVARTTARPR